MCNVNAIRTARFSPPRQVASLRQPSTTGRSLRYRGGLLTITTVSGRKTTTESYKVSETASDIGRGFVLVKVTGDSECYVVEIGGQGLVHCDCRGCDLGNWKCKHISAMSKLLELGLIKGGIPGGCDLNDEVS
jgi:hypothetical protein